MSGLYFLGVAGQVALLLWGTHMVTSGLLRGFGHRLQPWLERHLKGRFSAFLAGLGLTTLLQSSTATGLMSASFAARGIMTLATGLAVMLGANVGTALVAQVLSFDVTVFAPILVLLGFIGFRASTGSLRQWGRAAIGLGLMLIALHNLMETLLPLEHSETFQTIIGALNKAPWILCILALLLTWMCHSSVAVVLFTASIAQTGLVHPVGLLAMVLGANLGGAIPPMLETASVIGRRIPVGNAITRLFGVILCAPFLGVIAHSFSQDARLAVDFHLGFNIVLSLLAMPLLPLMGRLVERLLPLPENEDLGAPLYLQADLIRDPPTALAAATREVLRMVELTDVMFKSLEPGVRPVEKELREKLDLAIDRLGLAVRRYLSEFDDDTLGGNQRLQVETFRAFTIQMGHLTDVLLQQLEHVESGQKKGVVLGPEETQDLKELYGEINQSWQMMVGVVINPTEESAQALQRRKNQLKIIEEGAEHRYARRSSKQEVSESMARHGGVYLQILRNFRRLHSHIVGCAYPVLDQVQTEPTLAVEEHRPGPTVDIQVV